MGISLSLTELQTGVRERSVPSGLDCTYKVSILKKASPGLSSNSVSHHQRSVLLWQGQGRSWHGSQAALTPFHLKGSGCSPEDSGVLWRMSHDLSGWNRQWCGVKEKNHVWSERCNNKEWSLSVPLLGWRPTWCWGFMATEDQCKTSPLKRCKSQDWTHRCLAPGRRLWTISREAWGTILVSRLKRGTLVTQNHMDRGHCAVTGAAFVSTHLESHNSPFSARSDVVHGTTLRKAHGWPGPIRTDTSTVLQMSLLREELLIVFILP